MLMVTLVWLNGGLGCSSLDGLAKENGPLHFSGNFETPSPNPYSWTHLANVLYIDQPVGSGFSGGPLKLPSILRSRKTSSPGLGAFYEVFPSLKSKNTYIMGESYAAIYIPEILSRSEKLAESLQIPYFTQALLKNNNTLSLNLRGITIGDEHLAMVPRCPMSLQGLICCSKMRS